MSAVERLTEMVRDAFDGSSDAEQMLSNGPVAEMMADLREVLAQRADLLAALEAILDQLRIPPHMAFADDVDAARAAIAKARGGK